MIVLDASAAVDWLLQTCAGRHIEERIYAGGESLHAPHLLDLEVAQVLRRLAREGAVFPARADQAIEDLLDLRLARYPHFVCLRQIWRLGYSFTAYDAVYIALANKLRATLLTRDARLASACAREVRVELF